MEFYFRTKFNTLFTRNTDDQKNFQSQGANEPPSQQNNGSKGGAVVLSTAQTEDEEALLARDEVEKFYHELLAAREEEQVENAGITNVLGCGSPELLVLAAEAALRCGNLEVARAAVDEFFLQGCPKNQFYCRAFFAKALVDYETFQQRKSSNGKDAIREVVDIAMCIVHGIREVCFESNSDQGKGNAPKFRPRYNFLVYNGSVHMWNITRSLQRANAHARMHLVRPMSSIVDALDTTEDPNIPWRIQLKLALALAYDEGNQSSEALQTVQSALALVKRNDEILAAERPNRGSVTDGSTGRSSVSSSQAVLKAQEAGVPGVDMPQSLLRSIQETLVYVTRKSPAEAIKHATAVADGGRGSGVLLRLQCIRAGVYESDSEIESVLGECLNSVAGSSIENVTSQENDQNTTDSNVGVSRNDMLISKKADETDLLCEIGRVALEQNLHSIAKDCDSMVQRFKGEKKQSSIVLFDLFQAAMLIHPISLEEHLKQLRKKTRKSQSLKWENSVALSRRVEALKILESAVQSGLRFEENSLVEQACIVIWNTALPLLQPHLRKYVQKPFHVAATALEQIESCKTLLRARIHTEIAKCEIASDFIAKASVHANKALQLDYGMAELDTSDDAETNLDEEKVAHLQRPLDRTLRRMLRKLKLKGDIYNEPDTGIERAILSIEQAKDAREYHLKQSLLLRAVRLLDHKSVQPVPQADAAPGTPPPISEVESYLEMWGEIATIAWDSRMVTLAQNAASKVIRARRGVSGNPILHPEQDFFTEPVYTAENNSPNADENVDENQQESSEKPRLWRENLLMDWSIQEHKDVFILKARMHLLAVDTIVQQMRSTEEDEGCPLLADVSVRALGLSIPEEMITKVKAWEALYDEEVSPSAQNPAPVSNTTSVNDVDTTGQLDDDEENEYWFDTNLPQMKEKVIWHISQCLRIGKLFQEDWIVENACCYLWNYHFHVFLNEARAKLVLDSLVAALQEAEECMSKLRNINVSLYCSICQALASALEFRCSNLEKAVDVARKGIALAKMNQSRSLIGTLHRLQRLRGEPEKLPDVPTQRIFAVLELMKLDQTLLPVDERRTMLVEAIEGFQQSQVNGDATTASTVAKVSNNARSELKIELWTKLGLESLNAGLLKEAIQCLENAVSSIPKNTSACLAIAPKIWRWYSVAESAYGLALSKTISSSRQIVTLQDEIREQAFAHFVAAATCGVRAKRQELVIESAKHYWNVALPFLGSKITRNMLMKPTSAILAQVETIPMEKKDDDANELQLRLYGMRFQCYQDKEQWNDGLEAVRHAFRFIPQAFHTALWQARVLFSSKLGMDSVGGISKMKDVDASTQAKAFATLARKSVNPKDQLNAYQSALEILEDSFERVGYCIEFAEWLYIQHFPMNDVRDMLLSAVDILVDIENPVDGAYEDDEDEDNDDADRESVARSRASRFTARTGNTTQTKRSGRTMRSRGKTGSRNGRSVRSGRSAGRKSSNTRAKSSKRSASGRSVQSRMTGKSRQTARTGRTGGTQRTKRTGRTGKSSRWNDSENDELMEDDPSAYPERLGVPHTLDLIQSFVMLARLSSSSDGSLASITGQTTINSQLGSSQVQPEASQLKRQMTCNTKLTGFAGASAIHGTTTTQLFESATETELGARSASRAQYLQLACHYLSRLWEICLDTANQVIQKSGNSDKSRELFLLPNCLSAWIQFGNEVSTIVELGGTKQGCEEYTIHTMSVPQPSHRLHYLNELVTMLRECGMDQQCLPVHYLIDVLVNTTVQNPHEQDPLRVVHLVSLSKTLDRLGCARESRKTLAKLDMNHVNETNFSRLRDDVAQLERQCPDFNILTAVNGDEVILNSTTPTTIPVTLPSFFGGVNQAKRKIHTGFTMRELWVEEAEALLDIGELASSRKLLGEAMRHNNAHQDFENQGWASIVHARLLLLDGDTNGALNSAVSAWRCRIRSGACIRDWVRTAETIAECMTRSSFWREAVSVLDGVATAIEALPGGNPVAQSETPISEQTKAPLTQDTSPACKSIEVESLNATNRILAAKRVGEKQVDTCSAVAILKLQGARIFFNQTVKEIVSGVSLEEVASSVYSNCKLRYQQGCDTLREFGEPTRYAYAVLSMAQCLLRGHELGLGSGDILDELTGWLMDAKRVTDYLYATRVPPAQSCSEQGMRAPAAAAASEASPPSIISPDQANSPSTSFTDSQAPSPITTTQLGALLIDIEICLGKVVLSKAQAIERSRSAEHASMSMRTRKRRKRQVHKKTVQEQYLQDTAPDIEPSSVELDAPHQGIALAHFSSALALSSSVGHTSPQALCAVGAGIVQSSLLQSQWKDQQHDAKDSWNLDDINAYRSQRLQELRALAPIPSEDGTGEDTNGEKGEQGKIPGTANKSSRDTPGTANKSSRDTPGTANKSSRDTPGTASLPSRQSTAGTQAGNETEFNGLDDECSEKEMMDIELNETDLDPMKQHASVILRQGLEKAVLSNDLDSAMIAAEALVVAHGLLNTSVTVENLFLLQSLKMKKWLQSVWEGATLHSDPYLVPSLFMEQQQALWETYSNPSSTNCGSIVENYFGKACIAVRMMNCLVPITTALETALDTCLAARDSNSNRPTTVVTNSGSVGSRPSTALTSQKSAMDSECNGSFDDGDALALVLTLTPGSGLLYGGVKCKGPAGTSAASRVPVSLRRIARLQDKLQLYSKTVARFMVNYGNDRGEEGDIRSIPEPWEFESSTEVGVGAENNDGLEQQDDTTTDLQRSQSVMLPKLVDCESTETLMSVEEGYMDPEEMLKSIAGEVAEYLIWPLLDASPEFLTVLQNGVANNKALLLVADENLAKLPLELAFNMVRLEFSSVVRDFSVHLLYNRLQMRNEVVSAAEEKVGVKYVVDPRCESGIQQETECDEKQTKSMFDVIDKLSTSHSQMPWEGCHGLESGILGPKDWYDSLETFMNTSSSSSGVGTFLYFGFGNVFNYIEPQNLAGLCIPKCSMAVLLDRVTNEVTSRREAKIKTRQTRERLKLEEPLEVAALMSLIGAQSVVVNRWASTQHANEEILETLLEQSSKPGDTEQITHVMNRRMNSKQQLLLQRVRYNTLFMGNPAAKLGE